MVADYEVTWDTSYSQETSGRTNTELGGGRYRSEVSRHHPYVSHYSPDSGRAKRFRVSNDLHTELRPLILHIIYCVVIDNSILSSSWLFIL